MCVVALIKRESYCASLKTQWLPCTFHAPFIVPHPDALTTSSFYSWCISIFAWVPASASKWSRGAHLRVSMVCLRRSQIMLFKITYFSTPVPLYRGIYSSPCKKSCRSRCVEGSPKACKSSFIMITASTFSASSIEPLVSHALSPLYTPDAAFQAP